jgi:hypothetical protein
MSIKLHGKEYVEVKDRVLQAHKQEGYSMLSEDTFEMGGRSYVRVYIDEKGKQYIGTAEIKFNANPKTPDGQSPLECGETSALGRALGFAGYGVTESIASFDEVARNDLPERTLAQEAASDAPIPINAPTPRELRERHKFLGMKDDFETVKYKLLKCKLADDEMSPEMCIHINGFFDQVYAKAKEA